MRFLTLLSILMAGISIVAKAQSLSQLYEQAKPSVVVIETESKEKLGNGKVSYSGAIGSGVMISEEGEILTAAHVVNEAESIRVIFHDRSYVPAKVVRLSVIADVALIKLHYMPSGKKYPIAKLADSDKSKVGDDIFIIGAPFGLDYSLSKGIISGITEEKIKMAGFTFAEFFQTDAAINQGNSGGPMFNMNGEVIGIVSYIVSESGGFDGIGFAATSNITDFLVIDSQRRWTGINGRMLSRDLAALLNVPQTGGILIENVVPLSPAYFSDLQGGNHSLYYYGQEYFIGGDIVLEVNGIKLSSEDSIGELIRDIVLSSGEERKTAKLKVLRAGRVIDVELKFPE